MTEYSLPFREPNATAISNGSCESRDYRLDVIDIEGCPDVRRHVGNIWGKRLIVEADQHVSAIAIAERECGFDNLFDARSLGGLNPCLDFDIECFGGRSDQIVDN